MGNLNRLIYNNTYGEIKFIQPFNYSIEGDLRFGPGKNIDIGQNYVFLNSSSDISELNRSENITFRSPDLFGVKIYRDGAICSNSICNLLYAGNGIYVYNVTGWSNYSVQGLFAGGYGTQSQPYQISTCQQLQNLKKMPVLLILQK